jgi:hypothetical protein
LKKSYSACNDILTTYISNNQIEKAIELYKYVTTKSFIYDICVWQKLSALRLYYIENRQYNEGMKYIPDDEYFDMIDSFDLSDFKKKGIAMCTERGALAQNILSLFEFDSYYCMGYFNYDDKTEGHCYNIVRTVNGYRLVDFSVGVLQYSDSFERSVPFIADISTSEFEKFMSEDYEFTLENYEYEIIEDKSIRHTLGNRIYTNGKEPVVGKKL